MEVKCEYCGSMIPDKADKCPNCGATNDNMKRMADSTPKTIAELKEWYEARNLPPYETTRFFIGIDYKKPKAFGIYEENGEFIVYKNKDTGERAIRYQGTDEAYAVNELYLKLKSEILNQKAHQGKAGKSVAKHAKTTALDFLRVIGAIFGCSIAVILLAATAETYPGLIKSVFFAFLIGGALVLLGRFFFEKKSKKKKAVGVDKKYKFILLLLWVVVSVALYFPIKSYNTAHYYSFDNSVYCEYQGDWYGYNGWTDDYYYINEDYLPVEVYNNPADYEYDYNGYAWDEDYTFSQFQNSDYYNDNISWTAGDSDSDYSWDSGDSWSSDSTDWGSDW